MKKYYFNLTFVSVAMALSATSGFDAAAQKRIDVGVEAPKIYCVGLNSNRGVYTINSDGSFMEEKLSGSTYIQWGFQNSGGTFLSTTEAVGTYNNYSLYAVRASAEGGGDGPWSHTYFNYRDSNNKNYPNTLIATDMALDPKTGDVYGWFRESASSVGTYVLGKYDYQNISRTTIGEASQVKIVALAFDAKSTLWGIDYAGNLYTIDLATGSLDNKGSLGVRCDESSQSAAYDMATEKIYWGTGGSSAALYVVDTDEVTATKVYDFPMGKRFNGFYIEPSAAPAPVPAAVTGLSAEFLGSDSQVEVVFTAPSTDTSGEALEGTLNYTIVIDEAEVKNGTVAPGAEEKTIVTCEEGDHIVSVVVSNANGESAVTTAPFFVGFDTPGEIRDLTAVADGRNVELTWNHPAGTNGGFVDYTKMAYDVVRNPGNVKLLDAPTTLTTLSDVLPEDNFKEYTYVVTLIYDNAPAGEVVSEPIAIGSPYSLPYLVDFEGIRTLGEVGCKQIPTAANEELKWVLTDAEGNGCVSMASDTVTEHKAFFFTAPFELKAEKSYKLTYDVSNNSTQFGTALRINLSKSQTTAVDDHIYPYLAISFNHRPDESSLGKFASYEIKFTVEEDGVYHICFVDQGFQWYNNTVCLDNIGVEEVKEGGIGSLDSDNADIAVTSNGTMLEISGPESAKIAIYAVDGTLIASGYIAGGKFTATLQPGIYVVSANGSTFKIKI